MVYMVVDKHGRLTLPAEICREPGLEGEAPGLVLLSRTPHGTIELIPTALVPRDQRWFHHPLVQRRVLEAEADFEEGRFTRTETLEDAQAHPDGLKENGPAGA